MRPGFRKGDVVKTPLRLRARVEDVTHDGYELTYLDGQPFAGISAYQSVTLKGIHLRLYQACAPAR